MEEAASRFDWFKPTHMLADKGYDSKESFRYMGKDLNALPIIDVQQRKGLRTKVRELRPCEAVPIQELDVQPRFQCTLRPWDPKSPWFNECPFQPPIVGTKQHRVFELPCYERYTRFTYGSKESKALYNNRVSVERVFSRLKGYRKLNSLRVRGIYKARVHCLLATLVFQAQMLVT